MLKSAEISGLTFPRTGYDGTRAWYDEVTEGVALERYYTYPMCNPTRMALMTGKIWKNASTTRQTCIARRSSAVPGSG